MADVTLLRCTTVRDCGAATYVAVHTSDALEICAQIPAATGDPGLVDVQTMPWDTLPGAKRLAVAAMDRQPPRSVIFLGTTVDQEWTSWYLPCPPPPAPALTR
jgi:hypothetical protein